MTPEQAAQFANNLKELSRRSGVPMETLVAVAWQESKFNPAAVGTQQEVGLMQILPGTVADIGGTEEDLRNPWKNLVMGSKYLSDMKTRYGAKDTLDMLGGYNAGPGRIQGKKYAGIKSTHAYINSITKRINLYKSDKRTYATDLVKLYYALEGGNGKAVEPAVPPPAEKGRVVPAREPVPTRPAEFEPPTTEVPRPIMPAAGEMPIAAERLEDIRAEAPTPPPERPAEAVRPSAASLWARGLEAERAGLEALRKEGIGEVKRMDPVASFKVIGKTLLNPAFMGKQQAAAVLRALQGWKGASVVDRGWADKVIASADKDVEKFAEQAAKQWKGKRFLPGISIEDLARLPSNLAYSTTTLGFAAPPAAAVALAPVPGARPAAFATGMLMGGAVAFNQASYQIMQEYLEARNDESIAKRGKPMSKQEENSLKREFANNARKYGLWEAIPEAAGGALGVAGVLAKFVPGPIAARVALKAAGVLGEELATETLTQMGQMGIEARAGLREGEAPDWTSATDWIQALREVAPQTVLLTTVMGGAGAGMVEMSRAIQQAKADIPQDHPYKQSLDAKLERDASTIAHELMMEQTLQQRQAEAQAATVPAGRPAEEMPIAAERPEEIPAEVPPEAPAPTEDATKRAVRETLEKGGFVPADVLSQYPDLEAQYGEPMRQRYAPTAAPEEAAPPTPPAPEERVVEAVEQPPVREPWQMTFREYQRHLVVTEGYGAMPRDIGEVEAQRLIHKDYIGQALSEGRPVPPEVLADYPDLAAPPAQAPTTEQIREEAAAEMGVPPEQVQVDQPIAAQQPALTPEAEPPPAKKKAKVKKLTKPPPKPKTRRIPVLPDKKNLLAEIDAAIENAPAAAESGHKLSFRVNDIRADTVTNTKEDLRAFWKTVDSFRVVQVENKNQLLSDISDAIKAAPTRLQAEKTRKVSFKIDGGVTVVNTKEALQDLRKRVAGTPEKVTIRTQEGVVNPQPVASNRELVEELRKVPKGYFSDGSLIVRGTPPKSAKMGAGQATMDDLNYILKLRTEPARQLYYTYGGSDIHEARRWTTGDAAVSATPIGLYESNKIAPKLVFESGGKYYVFNQFKHNVIRKRFPDASYGIGTSLETPVLIAYDAENQPVAALAAMEVEVRNAEGQAEKTRVLDQPPNRDMAVEAGLLEGEVTPPPTVPPEVPPAPPPAPPEAAPEIPPAPEEAAPEAAPAATQEITAENIRRQQEIAKEKTQAGYVRIRKPGSSQAELREISKRVTGSEDFADEMNAYAEAHTLLPHFEQLGRRVWRDIRELVNPEANKQLLDAARRGRWPEPVANQIMRMAQTIRTHVNTAGRQGAAAAAKDAYGVWGELDAEQNDRLGRLIWLRSIAERTAAGLPEIANVTADQADQMFREYFNSSDAEVQSGFIAYDTFQRAFGIEQLVMTGKLSPADLWDFYAPHQRMKYLWNNDVNQFSVPVRAKPRFRPYLKKAKGGQIPMAVGLDVIQKHWATVYADNIFDTALEGAMSEMDGVSRAQIESELGTQEAQRILGSLRPHMTIPIGDRKYMAMQFDQGRFYYPVTVADPKLVMKGLELALQARNAADVILNLPPGQREAEIMEFMKEVGPRGGDALREALAVGRYKRIYIVPEPVYWRLNNLRSKNSYIPLFREAAFLTSKFKSLTLGWAGLPYEVFQAAFVDTPMLAMTAPGAMQSLPNAWRILNNIVELEKNPNALGPRLGETYALAKQEDVLGSGFLREYMARREQFLKHPIKTVERWRAMREVLDRLAMLDYQWHELHKQGKPFEAIHMEKDITRMTPEQAAGYIASNFTVDFENIPDWYRRYFRTYMFPFITGTQKGAVTLGRLMARMPFKRPMRFVIGIAVPLIAAQIWNNTGWRKKVSDKLGWWGSRMYTIPVYAWDDDGDGEYDRVMVWSPRTALDEAGEWIGFDMFMQKLHQLKAKEEAGTLTRQDVMDAAIQQIKDTTVATPQKLYELANPMFQAFEGIRHNRDPFTKRPVLSDPDLRGTNSPQEYKEYVGYILQKMFSPIAQLASQARGMRKGLPAGAGTDMMPKAARQLLAMLTNGPLDYKRAFGLYDVDLDRIAAGNLADEIYSAEKREQVLQNRIIDEFITDDRMGVEDVFQFWQSAAAELINFDNPAHPKTDVYAAIRDARARRIMLEDFVLGGPRRQGSLANRLVHPRTLIRKMDRMLHNGIDPKTGRKFTEEREREIRNMRNTMRNFDAQDQFKRTSLGVRAKMVDEFMRLMGITEPATEQGPTYRPPEWEMQEPGQRLYRETLEAPQRR